MSGLFHRVDFCSALSSSMGLALMSDGLSASRASGALSEWGGSRKKRGAWCVREQARSQNLDDSIFHSSSVYAAARLVSLRSSLSLSLCLPVPLLFFPSIVTSWTGVGSPTNPALSAAVQK